MLVEDSVLEGMRSGSIVFGGFDPSTSLGRLHLKNVSISDEASNAILVGSAFNRITEIILEGITFTNTAGRALLVESNKTERITVTDSTFDSIGGLRLRDYSQKMRP